MSEYEFWFFLFIGVVILFVCWYLMHTVANLDKKFEHLNDRVAERTPKWEFDYIDREVKETQEHINAIEKHLNITLVKEPARMVVKTGEFK